MPITEADLIAGIESRLGYHLDATQVQAICHGTGPLLIAAGPGTGKTEVLASRCLKFLCCDGVAPGSVFLTTFTDKAAQNLLDRVNVSFEFLKQTHPTLASIDPSELRVGTLHGLCNDIMQKYRYTQYQNLRLLDEVESALLIHRKVLTQAFDPLRQVLFSQFQYLFGHRGLQDLGKWDWALALRTLFSRIVEDRIDRGRLTAAGGAWAALETVFRSYEQVLQNEFACDFSILLRHFREFLDSAQGVVFIAGDGTSLRPPLTHVLVDEYQDTNPLQEDVYLRLASTAPHNITVVGDDDQALYRFRGGTVECMVGFSSACGQRYGIAPHVIYLKDNHRSHPRIVSFCNGYVTSFPQMAVPNARIAGKPPLDASRPDVTTYPAVSYIRGPNMANIAQQLAGLFAGLRANGVVADYSQCALLLRSTRSTPRNAGPFISAFEAAGIPVYNPRSKDFLEQDEIKQCLGAFVRIVDRDLAYLNTTLSPAVRNMVSSWVAEYDAVAAQNAPLHNYVQRAGAAVGNTPVRQQILAATPTILYRIIAHEPFCTYQGNPAQDVRLGKLTGLFESFCSQYGRGLYTSDTDHGRVGGYFLGGFYYGFCGYLSRQGVDDDDEDEAIVPSGFLPIMTVHQAKGLEFDFVAVGSLGRTVADADSHQLELDFRPHRTAAPAVVHSVADSMWHDEIRQHYVAYSRAKHALILVASNGQLQVAGDVTASFGAMGGPAFRATYLRL